MTQFAPAYANGNDRFNAEAAAWDSNPDVHRASDGALEVILKKVDGMDRGKSRGSADDGE